jgi:hypothetical protein
MIKVCGNWELGWNTPIMEYELWAYMLQDYGVDEWIMSPVSGIDKPNITEIATTEKVVLANPDLTPVYLDEKAEISLDDFVHPENALYILGKASYSPWMAAGSTGLSIKIDTPHGVGGLWPHQAVNLVLYDRNKK